MIFVGQRDVPLFVVLNSIQDLLEMLKQVQHDDSFFTSFCPLFFCHSEEDAVDRRISKGVLLDSSGYALRVTVGDGSYGLFGLKPSE